MNEKLKLINELINYSSTMSTEEGDAMDYVHDLSTKLKTLIETNN